MRLSFRSSTCESFAGAAWTVLNPLAMIVVYTAIFSQVMRARLPGVEGTFAYSIYLCAGVLTWQLFSEIISRAQGVFIENANLLKKLSGTNSIAYTAADPVALAKALTKVAKDVPAFRFKSGVVEGRVISIAEIQQLALLPSKEELISKIMFLLNAPAQRIAMALSALPRNVAVAVSEAIKANKFGSGGAGRAPGAEPVPEAAQ